MIAELIELHIVETVAEAVAWIKYAEEYSKAVEWLV